jgi:hypothetical protein
VRRKQSEPCSLHQVYPRATADNWTFRKAAADKLKQAQADKCEADRKKNEAANKGNPKGGLVKSKGKYNRILTKNTVGKVAKKVAKKPRPVPRPPATSCPIDIYKCRRMHRQGATWVRCDGTKCHHVAISLK